MTARKIWQYFKNSLSQAMAYRGETFVWSLISIISIFSALMLWLAIYDDKTNIAGFSRQGLISYYLMLFLLEKFIDTHPHQGVARDIRRGFLSASLLRPFPYLLSKVLVTFGGKALSIFTNVPALVLVFYFFGKYFTINANATTLLLTILSAFLSFILQLSLRLLVGLIAFWIQKVKNLFHCHEMVFRLFGGRLVPLALFPSALQSVAAVLPFRYIYSLPLEIYFEKLNAEALFLGISVQIVWVFVVLILLRFTWNRGLRSYSAVGG